MTSTITTSRDRKMTIAVPVLQPAQLPPALQDLDPSKPIPTKDDTDTVAVPARPSLASILEDMAKEAGLPWTPKLAAHTQKTVLSAYNLPEDATSISYAEMTAVVHHFRRVPRAIAQEPIKVAILGGGAFGTALASAVARRGHDVVVLMRNEELEHVEAINKTHKNTMCFGDIELPENIRATTDAEQALEGVKLIIHAIPVQFSLGYLKSIKQYIPPTVPVVSTSKGISSRTLEFMNEVMTSALGPDHPTAFMSGPSFAKGILLSEPTTVSLASAKMDVARDVQMLVSSPTFRTYTTSDVAGMEVTGSLKNVLAIAVGVVDGLGMGPNTQCGFVTRGWKDIYALAKAHGGSDVSMIGLAGMGDLILTCYGGMSRNNKFGQCLAKGETKEEAIKSVGQIVEGLPTAGAAIRLAEKLNVDVPVLSAVNEMLEGRLSAMDMVNFVMTMPLEDEFVC